MAVRKRRTVWCDPFPSILTPIRSIEFFSWGSGIGTTIPTPASAGAPARRNSPSRPLWGMFAGCAQQPSEIHQWQTVQPQGMHRSPARRCQTHNQQSVLAPGEMAFPSSRSWIEQRDQFSCGRIRSDRFVALVPIAASAGKSQIIQFSRPAGHQRHDVFDAKRTGRKFVARLAVFAQVGCALGHHTP